VHYGKITAWASGTVSGVSGKFEIHRYAVSDKGELASYVSRTETALKEFVSKVNALIACGDAVLFPKSQWDSMVDSHRSKSRLATMIRDDPK
jgi:hypothetical protein